MIKVIKLAVMGTLGVVLSAGVPMVAQANSQTHNPFQNGVTLLHFMRAQGIEPTNVDWFKIEPICAPMLQQGQSAYHQCKYEQATLSVLHATDQQECRVEVTSDYPRSLTRDDTVRFYGHSRQHQRYYSRRGISFKELGTHRRAGLIKCMKSLGWASAKDWRLGQR